MKRFLLLIAVASVGLVSCKKNKEKEFDREAMLENMASGLIVPEYTNLVTELASLKGDADQFISSPSFENLTTLRSQYTAAYLNFQRVKSFEFGPAADYALAGSMNTYPTDGAKIDANIASGTYTLGSAANTDAIGLPAVDYLLYAGEDTEVINRFSTHEHAANAATYLQALISKMQDELNLVVDQWNSGYKASFIAANGTDVGSSLGLMYNAFVRDMELVKNAKIGIPAGQFSGGETFPTYVEAFYSGQSQALALENLSSLKRIFTGGTGVGIDDYIDFVEEQQGVTVTSTEISKQFDICYESIAALGNPFSVDIPVNFDGFSSTFQDMKKLVAYAKTDITAALGVLITYSDTDGD